jgi:hypothetical protein
MIENSLIGSEVLVKKIIDMQKTKGKLAVGDYIVVTYGDVENKAG